MTVSASKRALDLVFMGTPVFAATILEALIEAKHHILAVYTQPPRPAGRGHRQQPSPVQELAAAHGLAVRSPITLRHEAEQVAFAALDVDAAVIAAYGLILPPQILAGPRLGCLNVHASLLPRWRGAAPIQRAIQAGDAKTGVCLMQMEAGLDTGPVLLHQELPIAATDTGGQLHDKLAELGAQVLSDGLGLLRAGIKPIARPQPEQGVTYAHKLDKAEAKLDWAQDAGALARTVRAFNPWPIAEATLAGERVRIHGAVALEADHGQAPGTVLAASRDGIDIACGQGALRLRVLQREGGKAITAADYLNARRDLRVGA
jgi:methionyl-tRNA formyltransferase